MSGRHDTEATPDVVGALDAATRAIASCSPSTMSCR